MTYQQLLVLAGIIFIFFILKHFLAGGLPMSQALALYQEGGRIVDVRSPGEYGRGHIDEALNIPLDRLQQELPKQLPESGTVILLHCASGSRSALAARQIQQMGYTRVHNLGGYAAATRLSRAIQKAPKATE